MQALCNLEPPKPLCLSYTLFECLSRQMLIFIRISSTCFLKSVAMAVSFVMDVTEGVVVKLEQDLLHA